MSVLNEAEPQPQGAQPEAEGWTTPEVHDRALMYLLIALVLITVIGEVIYKVRS
jgi:hypothetical protein